MIETTDISDQVRGILQDRGISKEVTERITASVDCEKGIDGTFRETITMGYPVTKAGFTRLKDCAISNMPQGNLRTMLSDTERLATFLDRSMRATPASKRLELPAWVEENSNARRNEATMDKAKALAKAAANEAANS